MNAGGPVARQPSNKGGPTAIDGFLSPAECNRVLAELAYSFWRPSMVVRSKGSKSLETTRSSERVSESTEARWFSPQLNEELEAIDRKIGSVLRGFRRRREMWQATRYPKGGHYDAHFDCGHWSDEIAGERDYTVLIFLDTPRRGGETCFPLLDLEIKPRAGRLLFWRNLVGGSARDPNMLHSSLPLLAGRKTVLITWVRQRPLFGR